MLAVSFFGPRHGRLLQAKINKSGILEVRALPIYSFRRKAEAPFDLFFRYYTHDPQGSPDYIFYSGKEEDIPAQTPKTSLHLSSQNKKISFPKEDDDSLFACLPRSYEICISLC